LLVYNGGHSHPIEGQIKMNEDSSRIAEDITDGDERRVIIANPRRYIPVILPMVYAVGNHAGIPMQEINMVYRLRNPRQFLQDFAPTPQNVGTFAIAVGISETISLVATSAGIPVLPAQLAFNFLANYGDELFRPSQHVVARLSNLFSQQTFLLTAPPIDDEERQTLFELSDTKRDRKICDCSFSSVIKHFQSLLMWKKSPKFPAEENNTQENSTYSRLGKTKTE
jgi:hypothetical protein